MSIIRRLTALPAGHRSKWLTLLAVLVVLVLASPLAGKVDDVEDNGPTSQLPRGADSTWVEQQLPAFSQDDIVPTAVVYARTGGLTQDDRDAIATDRQALTRYAAEDVAPTRFADDGAAAVITFGMDFSEEAGGFGRVPDVRDRVHDGLPDGLTASVTGPSASLYDSVSVFDGVNGTILFASAGVVAVLLLLTYRSPVMWLLPLLSIGTAAALSQAVVYLLGKHAGLPVDGQSGGVMPIMVFGVGTDYALLLIARYREELRSHADRHRAMGRALRKAGPAILASAATVVLGMCCLLLADMNPTRSLGAVSAVGVACAAVAMLTVLPMALVVTGRWVFWPFVPRAGAGNRPRPRRSPWHRLAGLVGAAPRRVWIGTAAALGMLALTTVGLHVGTTAGQSFRSSPESVTGQAVLAEHFAAGRAAPAEIVADGDDAARVRAIARSSPGIAGVSDPVVSGDRDQALIRAVLQDAPDSDQAREAVTTLRDNLAGVDGARPRVGGPTAQRVDVAAASARDALVVFPTVLAVVLLILLALLRAVVGPLVLIGSVVLSYGAALGAGGLAMRAMGFDAVDVSLPLLSFVFLVALGVDYTIFLMSRVREEVVAHGPHVGVLRGLVATGGVITSAGLVLAATFSVLSVMPTVFMIGMGVVVAVGVLLDTFVVRSLLVPGLATDLGPGFWAPSDVGRTVPARATVVAARSGAGR